MYNYYQIVEGEVIKLNYYESIVITSQSIGEEELNKIINRTKDTIKKEGGEFIKVENWGKRKMAYELNKEKKGNYLSLHFKSEGKVISKLEKGLRIDDKILKYMIIKVDEKQYKKKEDIPEAAAAG
ncbi:MAG: 30S ribosomal protein S6 [Nitrospirota bacterium]